VVSDLDLITTVANLPEQSPADRRSYRDALVRIYRRLPVDLTDLSSGDVLCVGPLREGKLLAETLGCLPAERSLTPSAKRISYQDGILVGRSRIPASIPHGSALIVDGVVASGATVMALLQALPGTVEQVTLLTAQSTAAGMWALHRYGQLLNLRLRLVVGHVSGVLNHHFYAVDPQDRNRLVLGDVGDTISDIPQSSIEQDRTE
jgi:hypothetical protein